MTQAVVPLSVTVHMNSRDISQWCRRVRWAQPSRYLEREFEITTEAWHLFEDDARYDIFASYDPGNEFAECVIRNGWLLPDKRRTVDVQRGQMPTVTVRGKSWSSVSFRRMPRETIVCIPEWGSAEYNIGYAERVLQNYDGPVGRIRVFPGCSRVDQAVVTLGMEAWLGVSWCLPFYPLGPVVIPPGKPYWEAMLDLVEPFAPEVFYDQWSNSVIFADRLHRAWDVRYPITLTGAVVDGVRAIPVHSQSLRRVIVRVPAWH